MAVTLMTLGFNKGIKRLLLWVTLPFFMVVSPFVNANMQVSPTQIFVAAERNAAGLNLLNTGTTPLHAQIRVYEWRQQNGEDKLLSTQAIIASPPMLKLTPGVNQLVRIVRHGPAPINSERSYRIIIDEVPVNQHSKQASNTVPQAKGLKFRLRYSIPVFLAPIKTVAIQPILNSRLIDDQDKRYIHIRNEGNAHSQIADLTWIKGQQKISIASGLSGYILPGQYRQWRLPDNITSLENSAFKARINGELHERTLVTFTTSD